MNWRDTAAGFATLADTSSGQVLSRNTLESEPFGWLKSQELVERGRALLLMRCGECHVHHTIETDDDGHFMTCAGGMERLSPDQITRWRCNWLRLGNFLNQSARLQGTTKTVLSDCLLELGLLGKPSNGHIVLLARGLGHPDKRKAVFNRLSEGASWAGGVLITATRFHRAGELPNRMKQVWLGDVLAPDHLRSDGVEPALWSVLDSTSHKTRTKRGQPEKPGDPVTEFLNRVGTGQALSKIGLEAASIEELQKKRFGRSKAHSAKYIENTIRKPFNGWKSAGFPDDFKYPH